MCVFPARHTRYIDATAVDYYRAFYGEQTAPNYRGVVRTQGMETLWNHTKSHMNIVEQTDHIYAFSSAYR